jgi:bifunctional non-homologous end joining protein LigD
MVRHTLATYRKKRDFKKTPEPPGKREETFTEAADGMPGRGAVGRFVVHEHHASRLHFDLRLEMGGVLKSFAVPKGPSLDPDVRRLAINTEDHPVKYLDFQGSIGDGQYGAGQMVIWDQGTYGVWTDADALRQYAKGSLHLEFHGEKMRGGFMLIRGREDRQWLLFKKRDDAAESGNEPGLLLPYGSRTEMPAGFEIPAELLRKAPVKQSKSAQGVKSPKSGPAVSKWPATAKKASLPKMIEPMLATLADKPFSDPLWMFETKWDGWRALLRKDANGVHLFSRSGKSLDGLFPELAGMGSSLRAGECLLDGEIVALDERGIPKFQLLQNRLKGKLPWGRGGSDKSRKAGTGRDAGRADGAGGSGEGAMVFYAFDMPYCEGRDLTACSLDQRKALLEKILPPQALKPGKADDASALRYSQGFEGDGAAIFEQAVNLGFEGVVAKLKSSPYRRGRSADWLKIKGKLRQEVVVGGYTEPRRSRMLFGSLVVGLYQGGKLVFTGHVGGGFNAEALRDVHGFMTPLETKTSPFAPVPKTNEKVQWIRPSLVAEVEFAEWTDDGIMRHPIFVGLRPDKSPRDCVRETGQPVEKLVEAAEAEVEAETETEAIMERSHKPGGGGKSAIAGKPAGKAKAAKSGKTTPARSKPDAAARSGDPVPGEPVFTHTEKKYWPKEGYTKGDLINYYRAVAPWLLPHLKDRPLILKRYPNGIEAPPFYQHDVKTAPDFVSTIEVEEPAGKINYALCQNEASLLWLANMGVIPQNPWLSRAPHLDRPDWIVFDLDPQEVAFPDVCKMALFLKEILDELALKAYAKTSGSRGIHVYVPLKPVYDFAQGLDFAQLVGALVVKRKPDAFTVERSLKLRKRDRIYFDCMQNSMGKSVASVYSVREKPGATVSAALDWTELKRGVRMEDFDIRTMPKRLEKKGDLFADVLKVKNGLEGAFKKLQKLL